jgi:hypothetical protein
LTPTISGLGKSMTNLAYYHSADMALTTAVSTPW